VIESLGIPVLLKRPARSSAPDDAGSRRVSHNTTNEVTVPFGMKNVSHNTTN